jgi:hypothetical protein
LRDQLETSEALVAAKSEELYQVHEVVYDLKKKLKQSKDEVGGSK